MKYCPRCRSKIKVDYRHPDWLELFWKIEGYATEKETNGYIKFRRLNYKVERSPEEIQALKDELNDETKKVRFFFCTNEKCGFSVQDDGLGYQIDRVGRY